MPSLGTFVLLTTFVVACSPPHLDAVRSEYEARPFVSEELWAAKVRRARDMADRPLTDEESAIKAGLTVEQVHRARIWDTEAARTRLTNLLTERTE